MNRKSGGARFIVKFPLLKQDAESSQPETPDKPSENGGDQT